MGFLIVSCQYTSETHTNLFTCTYLWQYYHIGLFLQVGEDSPAGTIVGTLIVEDEDANQEHKCEILNIIDVPFKVCPKHLR